MRISGTIQSASVAIVGMSKNAGKTTVLNSLIRDTEDRFLLGLTSIGRDGESVDVATVTPKPDVYVHEGTLFATASDMLKNCDVTLEILDTTGIYTPLGEVIIARARSDGFIQIAGPSTVEGLRKVHTALMSFGAQKVFFDGAISRKSLSVPTLCDEFILCAGASYSPSVRTTLDDTEYFMQLFTLPVHACPPDDMPEKLILYTHDGAYGYNDTADFISAVKKNAGQIHVIRLKGAVTDSILKPLVSCGIKDVMITADDPSKIMAGRKFYDLCISHGIDVGVVRKSRLCAVTVNPYSAYGSSYDADTFYEQMCMRAEKYHIPVFDVKR